MDVIRSVLHCLNFLRTHHVTVSLCYVKGHQDRNNSLPLSTSATMNVHADHLATQALKHRNIATWLPLPTDKAVILLHNKPVTSHRTQVLRSAFLSQNLRQYMKESNNWTEAQIAPIWWKIHEKALHTFSPGRQLILQKFLHSQLPCNVKNNMMFQYKPPFCSLCHEKSEDQAHMLRCPLCPERTKIRERFKRDFHIFLVNSTTNSDLARVLSFTVNAWISNRPIPKLQDLVPDASYVLKQVFDFQHSIGWEQFFKGRLHISWGEMYNFDTTKPLDPSQRRMDADTWGSKLVQLVWTFVLDMWFARNASEHNLDNHGAAIKKDKLAHHITWIREKIPSTVAHPYQMITHAELLLLPSNNLSMMLDQLITLYQKHRLNASQFEVT
jgi:hypothetical protein